MHWQQRHFINIHKALVIPLVLGMMWYFNEWGATAFVYLGLHGSYTLLWLLKERIFRDRRFEQDIPLVVGILFLFIPLAGYYVAPFIITSQHVTAPPWLLGVAVGINILGVFFHYVSDAQKFFVLKNRKGLITDGLFTKTRNPNYLGEMLIYSSFALLSRHWLPWAILAVWWAVFFRNMLRKDKSLARYPEFARYKAQSGLLLPKLW